MEQKKDYSLLRQFDLEAAKRGEAICDFRNNTLLFLAEAGDDVEYAIRATCGNVALVKSKVLRMAPLCWVEGRPVYKGDVLYYNKIAYKPGGIAGKAISFENGNIYFEKGSNEFDGGFDEIYALTLTPPKVKRDGWMNCYPDGENYVYRTEERANRTAMPDRIACIRIEWEE